MGKNPSLTERLDALETASSEKDQRIIELEARLARVGAVPALGVAKPTGVDLDEYKGKYKNRSGEVFGLKLVKSEDAHLGRTHQLKNVEHFWEGNEEEFRLEFEKE